MAWQPYVSEMMKNDRVCQAWIGGHNGATWAQSAGFSLGARTVNVTQEDGSTAPTNVNEPALLLEATTGYVSSGSGLWLNGQKFMCVNYMANVETGGGVTYLKTKTGGACLVKTKQCILLGIWSAKNSAGAPWQNPASCNGDVEELAAKLGTAGY